MVINAGGAVSIVGGESSALVGDYLRAGPEIYYGAGTTESTYIAPTATVVAWDNFIATAAPVADIAPLPNSAPSSSSLSNSVSSRHRTATGPIAAYAFMSLMYWLLQ